MTGTPTTRQHLERPETRLALRVQHRLLRAAREYLDGGGFTELLPPVIGPVTDPGGRGSKQIDIDYYGHRYKLMTSAILYKQASLLAFDRMYYVAPNVRLEPPETRFTGRHLAEFHQIDVEIAGAARDDAMRVAEELVTHIVRQVAADCGDELSRLGRDPHTLREAYTSRFRRLTHSEAIAELSGAGHPHNPDGEIDWAGEELLARKATVPFFVTDYPKGSRGFYDSEDPGRAGTLRNFDLLAPEGYGEIISGSQRESDYPRLVARIRESGENPAKYGWYLDVVRAGIPASAGFGLGVQRLTRYLIGAASLWEATAYPKLPGVAAP